MKILVTGGAGFIGSHIVEKYLNLGHDVYVIDDLSTGSLDNIRHLQNNRKFYKKLYVTIENILNYDVLLKLVGICDVIFHMAAAVGVKYIINNPLSSITTNIRGTENVLELCNMFRKKVLIASSSEVYGKHTSGPLVETDNVIYGSTEKFRWSYATAKLIDEFTALAYYREYDLPVVIVRLFNTVGPRQTGRYGMVIPRFVEQAIKNEPITIYGDGSQTRTFTHVEDVVEAFNKLVDNSKCLGEVINIGGTEEVCIIELAERIKLYTNSNSEFRFIPYEEVYTKDFEDMQKRVPSVEKLKSLIGFNPERNLDQILSNVIESYKNKAI